MKIAVIGSGISGLSAAYYLSKKHKVDLFEKDNKFGGHANTLKVIYDNKKQVAVDIGFMVFNQKTYPKLINFFSLDVEGAELEVLDGFDFNEYKIQYLLIEARDFNKTYDYLVKVGYIYIDSIDKINFLFGHKSFTN